MDSDGSNKQRLTFFNEPGHPHHDEFVDISNKTIVSDNSWSPDGTELVVLLAYDNEQTGKMNSKILKIELEDMEPVCGNAGDIPVCASNYQQEPQESSHCLPGTSLFGHFISICALLDPVRTGVWILYAASSLLLLSYRAAHA